MDPCIIAKFQVRIHRFLEKSKKKTEKEEEAGSEVKSEMKKEEFLRKKVKDLMKKQRHRQVQKIVKGQDSSKPWGQEAQAKVFLISKNIFVIC